MNKKWILIFSILSAVTGVAVADELPAITAKPLAAAPVIDGKLDDACWMARGAPQAEAASISLDRVLFDETGKVAAPTEVRIGYDDQWLYLGFSCQMPPGAKVLARQTGRRNPRAGSDDCVEIFLNPTGGKYNYRHFVLGAGNASREQSVTGPISSQRDANWSVGWRSATKVEQDGWTAEAAIPLYVLNGQTNLPFNVTRTIRAAPPQNVTWAPVGGRESGVGFHDPDHFGRLQIAGPLPPPVAVCDPVLLEAGKVTPYDEQGDALRYAFEVQLVNLGGQAGAGTLVVEDRTLDEKVTRHEQAFDIPPRGTFVVPVTVPVEFPADRTARVALKSQMAEDNPWIPVTGTEGLTALLAYPDLSVYTGEPEGRLTLGCALSDVAFAQRKMRLDIAIQDENGRKVWSDHYRQIERQGVRAVLPIGKWKPGSYTVNVRLKNCDDQPVAEATTRIRVAAPPPAGMTVSKIDHERMCLLVDGKPFFPYGWLSEGFVGGSNAGMAAAMVGDHDNVAVEWFSAGGHDQKATNYQDWLKTRWNEEWYGRYSAAVAAGARLAYEKYGLYSIISGPPRLFAPSYINWQPELYDDIHAHHLMQRLPEVVALFQKTPGMIAWMGYDEIDDLVKPYVLEHVAAMHRLDPYHILWSSARGLKPWMFDAIDLYSLHYYWAPTENPSEGGEGGPLGFASLVQGSSERAKVFRRPVWVVPQGQRLTYTRELTPNERRCGIYLPIIQGGKGVLFFCLSSLERINPFIRRIMAYTGQELAALAPMLLDDRPPQTVAFAFTEQPTPATLPPLPKPRSRFDPARPGNIRGPGAKNMPVVEALIHDLPDGGELILIGNGSAQALTAQCVLSSLSEGTVPGKNTLKVAGDVSSPASAAAKGSGGHPGLSCVKDYFSGQDYPVKDGRFTIAFEPYGVRILETTGSTRQKDDPVALGIAAVRPAAPKVEGLELVKNGSFEEAPPDTAWKLGGKAEVASGEAHTGKKALRLEGASNAVTCVQYFLSLKPSSLYRIRYWAKQDLKSCLHKPGFFARFKEDGKWVSAGPNSVTWVSHEEPTGPETEWRQAANSVFRTKDQPTEMEFYVVVSPGTEGTVWLDDVSVEELGGGNASRKTAAELAAEAGVQHQAAVYDVFDTLAQIGIDPAAQPGMNLLKNSSFEEYTIPGVPDHWGTGNAYDLLRFQGVAGPAWHGRYSLMLKPLHRLNVDYMFWTNWEPKRDFTLSAYARAEKADTLLRLFVRQYGDSGFLPGKYLTRDFTLGTEWQRLAWTFQIPAEGTNRWVGALAVGFWNFMPHEKLVDPATGKLREDGKIWVDAVQLELGGQATAYQPDTYKAPQIDKKWLSDDVFKELEKRK